MLGLTPLQIASFAIIIMMLGLFVWGRWRYDVVAVFTLLVAALIGVVPAWKTFSGFSNPVIIIIASVLVVGKAISSSGILDGLVRKALKDVRSPSLQVGALTASVAFLSAFIKNVGTLGIFMPIAIQVARRSNQSPSIYLMPLAFGSLIGGTMTLIGTSPNLLISSVREELGRAPYSLFDFAWVGLPLTCVAVVFLAFGWRLLPKERTGTRSAEEAFEIEKYTTELEITEGSPFVGKRVADLEHFGEADVLVRAIAREGGHHYLPNRYWPLYVGDVVTIQADSAAIKRLTDGGRLKLVGAKELEKGEHEHDELDVVEAIVTAESPLVGQTPRSVNLRGFYDVNLLAVSRAGHNRHVRLQTHRFQVGDVVALQGWRNALPAALTELNCLPLADRSLGLGKKRRGLVSLAILVVAMVLVSLHLVPVALGFFGSAVLVVLLQQLTLKEAYGAIEGPVIAMLGALIPVGEALKDTGATDVLGQLLASAGAGAPGYVVLAMMLVVSMLLTPFMHHAAAVLVLGPVAAVVAKTLGYNMDPFLMAVALGCACDFLTPIGHQNNLLVMGPGGYRFTDYWRLGLPLTVLVVLFGTPLIIAAWPLQ
ncbi:MAG: SLC13 family permease [Methyloceanibacter sp.]